MNRAVILAAALALPLAGCNMMSGLGQDMQIVGGVMQDTASDLQGGTKTGANCTVDAHGRAQGPDCHPPTTDNPPPLNSPQ